MFQTRKDGSNLGYYLFLLYTVSYFYRLPERYPFLGSTRFDFILGTVLLILVFSRIVSYQSDNVWNWSLTTRLFIGFLAYVILTIPMVQWPGTVLKLGVPIFLKTSVFYFFAVSFIQDESQLKRYVNVYLVLLLIIIMEPLFLYLTEGRMGYSDYSMGAETFERLSGMTNKVGGNPNGLASVVAITFPFIFFLFKYYRAKIVRIILLACLPASLVTLVLTGSRSGLLATLVAIMICVIKSRFKIIGVIVVVTIASAVWFQLSEIHKQRYLSIVDQTAQGRGSAEGRLEHVKQALIMFSERPVFGYGLGTYREANWNLRGSGLVSHNLYTGTLVELGAIGSIIFFMFIFSLFKNISDIKRASGNTMSNGNYCFVVAQILEVVLITQLAFSFFAGGPSYYIWYLLGGLSISTLRIANSSK